MEKLKELTLPKDQRTGFWTRLWAYLIDMVFTFIAGALLAVLVGDVLVDLLLDEQMSMLIDQMSQIPHRSHTDEALFKAIMDMAMFWMSVVAGATFAGIILIIMEGVIGQSIGKLLLKIKIVDMYGQNATPEMLWKRALMKYGQNILTILGGVSGIWILNTLGSVLGLVIFIGFFLAFTDSRQTIHDMVGKTIVKKVS